MNTQPCSKALSGIGKVRRYWGTADGVPARLGAMVGRIQKLGAMGSWLCFVVLVGMGMPPSAIAQTTVT